MWTLLNRSSPSLKAAPEHLGFRNVIANHLRTQRYGRSVIFMGKLRPAGGDKRFPS